MNKQTFPIRYVSHSSSNRTSMNCLSTISTRDKQGCVRTNFVSKEPLDLQCLPKIGATHVEQDVSKNLDFLTLEFWAIWDHPPSLPGCVLIRRQLLVQDSLVILQWHPLLLLQWFVTQMSLQQRPHRLESRLYNVTSEYDSSFILLKFWVPTPHFFEVADVHQCSKVDFLFCLFVLPE